MKNILCFGDSNTHGHRPDGLGRYKWDERWTGLLQRALGEEYRILEEGLNGRTTVWEDEIELDKSGKKHLPSCLLTHAPLDLVVLMLGTNDMKRRFSLTPSDIGLGIETLLRIIQQTDNERAEAPKILLAAPTYLLEQTSLGEMIGNRRADTLRLGEIYAEIAARYGTGFINVAEVTGPSPIDGIHLDLEGHKKVAVAMEKKIREMFRDETAV